MSDFQPVLSSITQVFGREELHELAQKTFIDYSNVDWGNDRQVLLREHDTVIKDQWNGTCTSFATVAAIENRFRNRPALSERSLWDAYGAFSTSQAINAAQNHWILEERFWPQHQQRLDPRYKGKGRYRLTVVDSHGTDFKKVITAIDNGNPCVVAMSTPTDLMKGKTQVEANTGFVPDSGHAVCISGYKVENKKGYFYAKNSWGTDCGDSGYQWVAFALFNTKEGEYAKYWEIKDVTDRGEQTFEVFFQETALLALVHKDLKKITIAK
jgi:hypothetical protein